MPFPLKKWVRWLAIPIVVCAFAFFVLQTKHPPPTYHGQELGYWISQAGGPPPGNPEAKTAIVNILTNHCYEIIQAAARERWHYERQSKLRKIVPPLLAHHRPASLLFEDSIPHLYFAYTGFQIAGADAKSAIPELTRLSAPHNPLSKDAIVALTMIGTNAEPAIEAVLTNRAHPWRSHALAAFPAMKSGLDDSHRVLSPLLMDPDPLIRMNASNILGICDRFYSDH